MKKYTPDKDGIDHINIYSHGKTELGRFLSNFTYTPIETQDGRFDSIEGYWYWLGTKDDNLRNMFGIYAKRYGQSIPTVALLPDNLFKEKITTAINIKINNNPKMEKLLKESTPPFAHYYVFKNKVMYLPKFQWMVDHIESIRNCCHDFTIVWLSEDLEGYRCKKCGHETVDI